MISCVAPLKNLQSILVGQLRRPPVLLQLRLQVSTARLRKVFRSSTRKQRLVFAAATSLEMAVPALDPTAQKAVEFMDSIGVGKIEEHTGGGYHESAMV
jgi:hypothetical protein